MRWTRTVAAIGLLAGLALGCSKKEEASMPAGAPTPEQEVLPGPPKVMGAGGGPGPKQRPAPKTDN
jgi:hypothetical protein